MKIYVITATDEYGDTWVEKLYTKLSYAQDYLIANIEYWKDNDEDISESLEDIRNIKDSEIIDQEFYLNMPRRGIDLNLSLRQTDEAVDII